MNRILGAAVLLAVTGAFLVGTAFALPGGIGFSPFRFLLGVALIGAGASMFINTIGDTE